jgi:predicted short-subunit dehydrogenase-like oxidoreductase (DUF2520 family)
MDVAVLGAGRVGTALAVLLARAGHRIVAVSGREATRIRAREHLPGVPVMRTEDAAGVGELVLVTVPDDELRATVERVGGSLAGRWVLHASGAEGLDVLSAARDAGARCLAVHPLQTFPDVGVAIASLPGCAAAVTAEDEEGYALGEGVASDVGAKPFRLPDHMRPLYHAAAVFASNYLVTVSGIAEQLLSLAGVENPVEAMRPLQEASLANVARMGPTSALTGPAARGDAGTVAKNIEALAEHAPGAVPAYVTLCRAALDVAGDRLDPRGRAAVEEVLDRWT